MWIKICGIRDIETAQKVAACGAQALGLNFHESSPRFVAPETACAIVAALPPGIEPVGLFVNQAPDTIRKTARRCGIRTVQLHGDEPPETIVQLQDFTVVRAFRVGDEGLHDVAEYLASCRRLGALPSRCLIDARVEGQFGGTGKTAPWEMIRRDYLRDEWPPLILAGGLTPSNVAAAIDATRPWGVDVAGGVESAVACKEAALVRKFVEEARRTGA